MTGTLTRTVITTIDEREKRNKEYSERQYREDVNRVALIQMEHFKEETSRYGEFDYGDEASERVSSTAQLCIAANLIRLNETLEDISRKLEHKNG